MDFEKISLWLFLVIALVLESEGKFIKKYLIRNSGRLDNELDDNCFCFIKPGGHKKVPDILTPNKENLERIVVYLYRDKSTKSVKMYIPNEEKQALIPNLAFEVGDKLITVGDDKIKDILPHRGVINMLPHIEGEIKPDGHWNIDQPQTDVERGGDDVPDQFNPQGYVQPKKPHVQNQVIEINLPNKEQPLIDYHKTPIKKWNIIPENLYPGNFDYDVKPHLDTVGKPRHPLIDLYWHLKHPQIDITDEPTEIIKPITDVYPDIINWQPEKGLDIGDEPTQKNKTGVNIYPVTDDYDVQPEYPQYDIFDKPKQKDKKGVNIYPVTNDYDVQPEYPQYDIVDKPKQKDKKGVNIYPVTDDYDVQPDYPQYDIIDRPKQKDKKGVNIYPVTDDYDVQPEYPQYDIVDRPKQKDKIGVNIYPVTDDYDVQPEYPQYDIVDKPKQKDKKGVNNYPVTDDYDVQPEYPQYDIIDRPKPKDKKGVNIYPVTDDYDVQPEYPQYVIVDKPKQKDKKGVNIYPVTDDYDVQPEYPQYDIVDKPKQKDKKGVNIYPVTDDYDVQPEYPQYDIVDRPKQKDKNGVNIYPVNDDYDVQPEYPQYDIVDKPKQKDKKGVNIYPVTDDYDVQPEYPQYDIVDKPKQKDKKGVNIYPVTDDYDVQPEYPQYDIVDRPKQKDKNGINIYPVTDDYDVKPEYPQYDIVDRPKQKDKKGVNIYPVTDDYDVQPEYPQYDIVDKPKQKDKKGVNIYPVTDDYDVQPEYPQYDIVDKPKQKDKTYVNIYPVTDDYNWQPEYPQYDIVDKPKQKDKNGVNIYPVTDDYDVQPEYPLYDIVDKPKQKDKKGVNIYPVTDDYDVQPEYPQFDIVDRPKQKDKKGVNIHPVSDDYDWQPENPQLDVIDVPKQINKPIINGHSGIIPSAELPNYIDYPTGKHTKPHRKIIIKPVQSDESNEKSGFKDGDDEGGISIESDTDENQYSTESKESAEINQQIQLLVKNPQKDLFMPDDNRYETFNRWFIQQMQRFKTYTEHDKAIDLATVERYILKILRDNDMHVTPEGILTDSFGTALDLHNLQLRPILIGKPLEFGSVINEKVKDLVLPANLAYLQAILVTNMEPSMILGIIPIGKTVIPPSAINAYSTLLKPLHSGLKLVKPNINIRWTGINPAMVYRHGISPAIYRHGLNPAMYQTGQLPVINHWKKNLKSKPGKTIVTVVKKTPVLIRKWYRKVVPKEQNIYDSFGRNLGSMTSKNLGMPVQQLFKSKLNKDAAKKLFAALKDNIPILSSNINEGGALEINEDDIAGRIVGGSAATGSGAPLSMKGRMKDD